MRSLGWGARLDDVSGSRTPVMLEVDIDDRFVCLLGQAVLHLARPNSNFSATDWFCYKSEAQYSHSPICKTAITD